MRRPGTSLAPRSSAMIRNETMRRRTGSRVGWAVGAAAALWIQAPPAGAQAAAAPVPAVAPARAAAPAFDNADSAERLRSLLEDGPGLLLPRADRQRIAALASSNVDGALAEARAL